MWNTNLYCMLSSLKRAKYFAPLVDAWLFGPHTSMWKSDPALFDHGIDLCFGNSRHLFFPKAHPLQEVSGNVWFTMSSPLTATSMCIYIIVALFTCPNLWCHSSNRLIDTERRIFYDEPSPIATLAWLCGCTTLSLALWIQFICSSTCQDHLPTIFFKVAYFLCVSRDKTLVCCLSNWKQILPKFYNI